MVRKMRIEKVTMDNCKEVRNIYSYARKFMAENGNASQWGQTYPDDELILSDISRGKLFKCTENSKIKAVFYCSPEKDHTYSYIENGSWLDNDPYTVIHRIASAENTKGAATFCINYALDKYKNIRIDTHHDNIPMQNLLKKLGFSYCGTIYIDDGSPRCAFQKHI